MQQSHPLRQSGYTLIELLLYVIIVSTLLTAVTYFFAMSTDARVKNQSITEVDDQASDVMDLMTQTIRNATSITSPAAGASAAALTIVVPTGSLSPTIFDLSSTTMRIKEGAAAAVAITSPDVEVTSLTFKNLTRTGTSGMVQISFTLRRLNPATRNEYDYQKTFTSSAEIGY